VRVHHTHRADHRDAACKSWHEGVVTDPTPPTPFDQLGGREAVVALARAFYDAMERAEPALTAVHRQAEGAAGRVHPEVRERFTLFLIGWLGGPQDYVAQHGHPRLRMRHAQVLIDDTLRDAWLRAMSVALDENSVQGDLRRFLDGSFAHVADFLRNQPSAG
jgi:hemoglobin